jgi:hypothetical protein
MCRPLRGTIRATASPVELLATIIGPSRDARLMKDEPRQDTRAVKKRTANNTRPHAAAVRRIVTKAANFRFVRGEAWPKQGNPGYADLAFHGLSRVGRPSKNTARP